MQEIYLYNSKVSKKVYITSKTSTCSQYLSFDRLPISYHDTKRR